MSAADKEIQELMGQPELADDEAARLYLLLQPEGELKVSKTEDTVITVVAAVIGLALALVVLGGIVRLGVWIWP